MQDKDLYIKFICSNLHIQYIFHTSKTIHKMKFFQISIVKIYIPVKKKDHNLILCIPNCQKSWKKNRRKKFKYVIHFHSSIDLHLVATQGELLGTCLCNFLDLSPFISDEPVTAWANILVKHNHFMVLWSSSLLFP